jgi:hypothetical protein
MKLEKMFAKHDDEYLEFKRIENPRHPRPDICAFLMLHEVCPGTGDMVCSAEHDQIWLDVDVKKLAKVATSDLIRDLTRCGVLYDEGTESLSMNA